MSELIEKQNVIKFIDQFIESILTTPLIYSENLYSLYEGFLNLMFIRQQFFQKDAFLDLDKNFCPSYHEFNEFLKTKSLKKYQASYFLDIIKNKNETKTAEIAELAVFLLSAYQEFVKNNQKEL